MLTKLQKRNAAMIPHLRIFGREFQCGFIARQRFRLPSQIAQRKATVDKCGKKCRIKRTGPVIIRQRLLMAAQDPERISLDDECIDAVRPTAKETIAVRRNFCKPAQEPQHRRNIEMNLDGIGIKLNCSFIARKRFFVATQLLQRYTTITPAVGRGFIDFQSTVVAFSRLGMPSENRENVTAAGMRAREFRLELDGQIKTGQGFRRPEPVSSSMAWRPRT